MARRVAGVLVWVCLVATTAAAQSTTPAGQQAPPAQPQTTAASQPATTETRPATTTFYGDTGLWFVPTGEILPNKKVSVSGYRAGFNEQQGFTNVSYLAGTFGVGLGDRAEVFGSWRFDTRIDRDVNPIFTSDPSYGSFDNTHPYVTQNWIGNQVGDLFVGAKVNVLSEYRQKPVAFAVRGIVKLPTGNRDSGASTGKADLLVDAIVSKDVGQVVEISGYGGFAWRGKPDNPVSIDASNGIRYGIGIGVPSHSRLRLTAELTGEALTSNPLTAAAPLAGVDGSLSPLTSDMRNPNNATLGLTFQAKNGFFIGGGINWSFPGKSRSDFGFTSVTGDYFDYQVRIGYHPGVRVYVAPAPPPPPPPAPPPPSLPPTVKARCEPCTVEVGKTSTVTADANSPEGYPLTYRWTAPAGTFANPAERQTIWTAPDQVGTVPVTVTVNDGHGGTASDSVNIQVVRPPKKTYTFEDVHFDFDRHSLRPEATRILDEAVNALKEDPTLRIQIEGNTCNIGTAEYNLALGERRASSVRDYLISRGIAADRLTTVSYGEERPKYDNDREETRRLNRRAVLVVKVE
jgi:outer membrane protein OmpA-like peptidoglycan-associated protein